jgi:hypothetical protein
MSAVPELFRERLPVWKALSEFFLDTQLQANDPRHMAGVLAQSSDSEEELWKILRFEIYPPYHLNLLCLTGEWALFSKQWLMERVAPHYGKRPKITWPITHRWMFRDHWNTIRRLVREARTKNHL